MVFRVEQESYLRDLFNQTLPHRYMTQLSTPLVSQTVPAFWQQVEADFGQNNAMGSVDMIQEFEAVLAMDFASVTELFQRLRGVRNRLNRQGEEVLRVHLLPSQLMIGKVLALLPSHLWGPSSKAEIQAMSKTSRDPVSVPMQINFAAKSPGRKMKGQFKRAVKREAVPFPVDDMQTVEVEVMKWRSLSK
ncbi:hypothetical protein F444_19777 [Phytophthora nicotianae P1976]|nr:hypothetical protein F444_19777 [Phytophthora nicotianae P1976]